VVKSFAAAVLMLALTGLRPPAVSLPGAWHTVEARHATGLEITDPGDRNVHMFSRNHFTIVWTTGDRPRFTGQVSDSQRVAMWQDVGAQAGRYDLVRDTLVLHSEIAKSPSAMAPGAFQKYSVRRTGASIWLQLVADNSGPLPNQERIRLERLE